MQWKRLVAISLMLHFGNVYASAMYVFSNGSKNLYTVDVGSLSGDLVGNDSRIGFGFGGLGFANDGTLYGYYTRTFSLYTVDTENGQWSLLGTSNTTGGDSFDIDPTTNKGYLSSSRGELHELDLATGDVVRTVAPAPFFTGASFSPDGTFYTLNSPISFTPNDGTLSTLNVTTGVASPIGTSVFDEAITNMAFNPDDGFLYSVGIGSGNLWRIDPTNAATTNLGAIAGLDSDGGQFTMSTFQMTGAVPIPATAWLFASALGVFGYLGKRKAAA